MSDPNATEINLAKEYKSLKLTNKIYSFIGIFYFALLTYMFLRHKTEDVPNVVMGLAMLNFLWTGFLSTIILKLIKNLENVRQTKINLDNN